jgi:hypothetical protein
MKPGEARKSVCNPVQSRNSRPKITPEEWVQCSEAIMGAVPASIMNKILGLFIILVVTLTCEKSQSHPGGLDKYDCHHDRKGGGYHCHRGGSSGSAPLVSSFYSNQGTGCRMMNQLDRSNAIAGRRVDLSGGSCKMIFNPTDKDMRAP